MTASVSPSSSPSGYKDHVSTVTFTMAGLSNSTNYWLVLNPSGTATSGTQQTGQFHATFDQECVMLPFKTDGSGAATVKWIVNYVGTINYQVVAVPTYSAVASTTGTITAVTSG